MDGMDVPAAAAEAEGPTPPDGYVPNRIQVSNVKKPLFFYVNLTKQFLG